jgi:hypothetical protein
MGSVTDVSHCTICSMSSDHEDMDLDLDLRVGDLYLDLDLKANDLDLDSDLRSEDLTTTLLQCHQYYLLSLQLTRKNTRRSKFLDVRLSFPLVSSPHTLKIRSAYASDAGALSRSNASGDNTGNLEAFVSQKLMTLRRYGRFVLSLGSFICSKCFIINISVTIHLLIPLRYR